MSMEHEGKILRQREESPGADPKKAETRMLPGSSWLRPEQAAHRLREFVAEYTLQEPEHQRHIELKLKHSLRVWVRSAAN
ncbi:MAG: hypothetical protein ACLFQG_09175 [Desulfovermiculus sp.]